MIVNDATPAGQAANPFSDLIRTAADATGVNFNYLYKQAAVESGFNATAQAPTSSARGLYQFTKDTWLKVIEQHGEEAGLTREASALRSGITTPDDRQKILDLRNNPEISARMAAHFALDNARALQAQGVQVKGPTELYLAHFLGSGGAAKFLNGMRDNPNAPAASLLPAAAQANKSIFFSNGAPVTLATIYERFDRKFNDGTAATPAALTLAKSTLVAARQKPQSTLVEALLETSGQKPLSGLKAEMPKIKSLLFKQAPQRDQKLEAQPDAAEADDDLLTLTPRREIRLPAQSAPMTQPQSSGQTARFSVDDNGPVSVDSLAKFLDRASQWSPDAGALDQQSKKGVVTRAATEGLRQS
ncbi:MAG: transglycosylase SLT domain-containing protein [Alphaproteobacteria bacterium]